MASMEMDLLEKCTHMVHSLLDLKENFSLSIVIGDRINFNFSNFDMDNSKLPRRISPSQRKRNYQRKIKYEQERIDKTHDVLTSKSDCETQTEEVETVEVGCNTDEVTVEKLEDVLKVDSNGTIHPSDGEVIVEVVMSHDFKTWEEIEHHFNDRLKMEVRGRPWIANNGRMYKTIGFRTSNEDYEKWRMVTFNWQDSGIRKVSSSKLYK